MTTQKRFRMDNTEGYSQADLDALNEAFDYLANECVLDPDHYNIKSWHDHIVERLLTRYDGGDRGPALISVAYNQ
jgi:hypothetical protein